jgi:hypothetical protein
MPAHFCIRPACGHSCNDCNLALPVSGLIAYAKRYAYMRNLPEIALNVAGIPCVALPTAMTEDGFLSGKDADDAIDNAMKVKP